MSVTVSNSWDNVHKFKRHGQARRLCIFFPFFSKNIGIFELFTLKHTIRILNNTKTHIILVAHFVSCKMPTISLTRHQTNSHLLQLILFSLIILGTNVPQKAKTKKKSSFFSYLSTRLSSPLHFRSLAKLRPLHFRFPAKLRPLHLWSLEKHPYHCDFSSIMTSEPHLLNPSCKNLCRSLPSPWPVCIKRYSIIQVLRCAIDLCNCSSHNDFPCETILNPISSLCYHKSRPHNSPHNLNLPSRFFATYHFPNNKLNIYCKLDLLTFLNRTLKHTTVL